MAGGLFISADNSLLDEWTGDLADAIIPVWDAAGNPWKISAASVLTGSENALLPYTAVGGTVENIAALHGKNILMVFRGTSFAGTIITVGTPGPFQIKWNNIDDELTCPDGNEWGDDEILNIVYKA